MNGVDVSRPCPQCGGSWHVASPAYDHSAPSFAHYCNGRRESVSSGAPEAMAMAARSSADSAANAVSWAARQGR